MSRRTAASGFTLVELLVALTVFAALAAIAYGALDRIAQVRGALAAEQDRFGTVVRSVSDLARDLRQAISRPVRGNYGELRPALVGTPDHVELTRLGFANPLAAARSNLERVVWGLDERALRQGRYAVLDRAPTTAPATRTRLDDVDGLRLRYLGGDGAWREYWPPDGADPALLPRAVELRLALPDLGELRRVLALPASLPPLAPDAAPAAAAEAP